MNGEKIESIVKWAGREEWDCLMALPIPRYPGPEMAEANVWPWIRAIERHDGTWSFRFIRFQQIGRIVSVNDLDQTLILVGGLGSGEWRYWSLQWAARNGNPNLRGRMLWSSRGNKPLGPILRNHCSGEEWLIQMRFGTERLGGEPCLKVDNKGIPYDLKLRKALKRGLKAAETKALEPSSGIVVSRFGTGWQSVLDWGEEKTPK